MGTDFRYRLWEQVLNYFYDNEHCSASLESNNSIDVYLAIWSIAAKELRDALTICTNLLIHGSIEQIIAALCFSGQVPDASIRASVIKDIKVRAIDERVANLLMKYPNGFVGAHIDELL